MAVDKKIIKKDLRKFYEKLSLIRKRSKPSKSMDFTLYSSEKEISQMLDGIDMGGLHIADIGGADGDFIFNLASKSRFSKNSDVALIDISPHYLNRAKKRYLGNFKGKFKFHALRLDADDLKLKNKFDIVFFRNILEHLYFPDEIIVNIRNSLKKNGLLYVLTPNRNRLNELVKKFIPSKKAERLKLKFGTDVPEVILLEKKMNLKEHIHEYSLKELEELMKKHQFRIVKERCTSIPFIIPSMCDRRPLLFQLQKVFILFAGFIGLNKFLGFEYALLAKKT